MAWVNSRLAELPPGPAALACPQCDVRYHIVETSWLPRPIVYVMKQFMVFRQSALVGLIVTCISGSAWIVCWTYGVTIFTITVGPEQALSFFQRHIGPIVALSQRILLGEESAPSMTCFLKAFWRIGIGMSVIPLSIASQRFRLLNSWSPLLTWPLLLDANAFGSAASGGLRWSQGMTCALLPYAYTGYSMLRRWVMARSSSSFVDSALNIGRALDAEDDDDDEFIRISENSVISLLCMPVASALTGWVLFRRAEGISPFYRACLGGLLVTLGSDCCRLLYVMHEDRTRKSRRVQDLSQV